MVAQPQAHTEGTAAERPLFFATENDATLRVAKTLGAELAPLPSALDPDLFEPWRAEAMDGPPRDRIVVSVWLGDVPAAELLSVDEESWRRRFELPYLLWNFALGAAGRRCADGGAIVALAQAPAALDAPGLTPELAISDGVLSLVRSVAAAEGARGVRANLVTTPIGLVEGEIIAPAVPLEGFPRTLDRDVAGAVRSFLSPDAAGLTGRVLCADGGRSL